jgi:serine/threonine protein kinase
MITKCPPFRSAQMKDPYFRRLCSADKKAFWKIFNSLEMAEHVKDLFEKMTDRDPTARQSVLEVRGHPWLSGPNISKDELKQDLEQRSLNVAKISESTLTELEEIKRKKEIEREVN